MVQSLEEQLENIKAVQKMRHMLFNSLQVNNSVKTIVWIIQLFCVRILEYIVVLTYAFPHFKLGGIVDTEKKAKSRGLGDFLDKMGNAAVNIKNKVEDKVDKWLSHEIFSSQEIPSSSSEENGYTRIPQQYNQYPQQYDPYPQQYDPYQQQYNPYPQQYNQYPQQYSQYPQQFNQQQLANRFQQQFNQQQLTNQPIYTNQQQSTLV